MAVGAAALPSFAETVASISNMETCAVYPVFAFEEIPMVTFEEIPIVGFEEIPYWSSEEIIAANSYADPETLDQYDPYYIYNGASFGDMFAYDYEQYPIEWYDYSGVDNAAPHSGSWFYPSMHTASMHRRRPSMRRRRAPTHRRRSRRN